jgi:hypothetical protein
VNDKGSGELEKRARKPKLPVGFRLVHVLSNKARGVSCVTTTVILQVVNIGPYTLSARDEDDAESMLATMPAITFPFAAAASRLSRRPLAPRPPPPPRNTASSSSHPVRLYYAHSLPIHAHGRCSPGRGKASR